MFFVSGGGTSTVTLYDCGDANLGGEECCCNPNLEPNPSECNPFGLSRCCSHGQWRCAVPGDIDYTFDCPRGNVCTN